MSSRVLPGIGSPQTSVTFLHVNEPMGGDVDERDDIGRLAEALAGNVPAAGVLYDRYAGALFALATTVTDMSNAERAVLVAFSPRRPVRRAPQPDGVRAKGAWDELARRTLSACAVDTDGSIVMRNRALLALVLHGNHSYRDAAAVLSMSPDEAAEGLRQSLREAHAA